MSARCSVPGRHSISSESSTWTDSPRRTRLGAASLSPVTLQGGVVGGVAVGTTGSIPAS